MITSSSATCLDIFFMKTARAEAVIAADDMAFLDRLWEDWSPGL